MIDKTLQGVLLFHEVFGQYISEEITVNIPEDVKRLRHNLMSEEYLELLKAEGENDVIEVADALCDLKYVLNGTIIAHGLHNVWGELYPAYEKLLKAYKQHVFRLDDYIYSSDENFVIVLLKLDYFIKCKIEAHGLNGLFDNLFAEVQRSNMSKTCRSLAVAEATVEHYKVHHATTSHIKPKGDIFLVYRNHDMKVLKSIEYSPADIARFLPLG